MRPPLPLLSRLAIAALRVPLRETGAHGLALDGPASVPTQAKRDADGLAVDARTFLVDARAVVASVEREVVFEPELAEEARTLIERGAQLAADALAVEEGDRSALQAAVEDLRAGCRVASNSMRWARPSRPCATRCGNSTRAPTSRPPRARRYGGRLVRRSASSRHDSATWKPSEATHRPQSPYAQRLTRRGVPL